MPKKTGWIAALSAHTTADNREITESVVNELAQTYDTNFYTARINLEHIGWYSRFGDVLEVKSKVEDGIKKLFVRLQANELLESINKADQAVFLSVEFVRNFAGTGKAYLTGLALTDQPASIGTGRVSLSVNGNDQEVEVIACGCKLDYNAQDDKTKTGIIANLIKKLNNDNNQESTMNKENNTELTTELTDIKSANEAIKQELSTLKKASKVDAEASKTQAESIDTLTKNVDNLQKELTDLKNTLSETLEAFKRPLATGGKDNNEIDDNII